MADKVCKIQKKENKAKVSEVDSVVRKEEKKKGNVETDSRPFTVKENVTETDAWPFQKPAKELLEQLEGVTLSSRPSGVPIASVLLDDEYYKMNHAKRGVAVVFNHIEFDARTGMGKRTGSGKDAKRVEGCLTELGFEVRVYTDLLYQELSAVLELLSKEDHSYADCFIMVVMSHGERGILFAKNHQYPVDEIWNQFTGDLCPTLAGKPKLFFLQACRGDKLDSGVTLKGRTQTDSAPVSSYSYTIPAMADILVMYSTFEGYYAWRSPDKGSWFIQSLCAELEKNSSSRDLLTMLTFVCRRVAVGYASNVPANKDMDQMKQIPSIVSMLTRLVFLGRVKK